MKLVANECWEIVRFVLTRGTRSVLCWMTIAVFKLETDYPSENYPLDYPSRCENETINVFTLETDYPSETNYPLDNSRQIDNTP